MSKVERDLLPKTPAVVETPATRRGGVRLVVTDRSGRRLSLAIDPLEALGLIDRSYLDARGTTGGGV